MKYDEFVGQVQNRARLATSGEAVRAIQATFKALGTRLYGQEAQNLAAQLPPELGDYLTTEENESFPLEAFFERVAEEEGVDLPDAVHHARAVVSVLQDAVSIGEIADVRAQLPDDYDPLFEAGAEGELGT
jgi:uncharacterized protein (DUF2267 family)